MNSYYQKAYVVFSNNTDLFFLGLLKKNFRHCFLILSDGQNWISVDPLFTNLFIDIQNDIKDEKVFIKWLSENNYKVLEANIQGQKTFYLPGLCTCVGVIKKILGVRQLFMWTPHQLYKYLKKNNEKQEKE